jgi:hypothetical protein
MAGMVFAVNSFSCQKYGFFVAIESCLRIPRMDKLHSTFLCHSTFQHLQILNIFNLFFVAVFSAAKGLVCMCEMRILIGDEKASTLQLIVGRNHLFFPLGYVQD